MPPVTNIHLRGIASDGKMPRMELHAHIRVINLLGGKAALARALGIKPTRATKWHKRGIPARYWPAVEAVAREAELPDITAATLAAPQQEAA